MQKSTIDSERQFWTAPDPNPARVLIRSRYLFWSLDPQTVSSENQEKIVLLGHFLFFSVCDVMGSAGGHHVFRGGCGLEFGLLFGTSLCARNVACENGRKKSPLKSIVDEPFNERFDSNTRVERIALFSNLRAKFPKNSIDFCRPSTATLLIPAQPSSKALQKLLVSLRPKASWIQPCSIRPTSSFTERIKKYF